MPVTIDQESFPAESMGMTTVEQVITHAQRDRRIVVNVMIDGQSTPVDQISRIRKSLIVNQTLYIETAQPGELALDVLDHLRDLLNKSQPSRQAAIELLDKNQIGPAMEKLSAYFSNWQQAHESVIKVSQLLGLNLEAIAVAEQSIEQILTEFTLQLRQVKQTLSDRDFVTLSDILIYEAPVTLARWLGVADALGEAASPDSVAGGRFA
jgi:hypothetical protein